MRYMVACPLELRVRLGELSMKIYQEDWLESLEEFTTPWGKTNMENNVLGVCCNIIGDDTGHTDQLAQRLAIILQKILAERIVMPNAKSNPRSNAESG